MKKFLAASLAVLLAWGSAGTPACAGPLIEIPEASPAAGEASPLAASPAAASPLIFPGAVSGGASALPPVLALPSLQGTAMIAPPSEAFPATPRAQSFQNVVTSQLHALIADGPRARLAGSSLHALATLDVRAHASLRTERGVARGLMGLLAYGAPPREADPRLAARLDVLLGEGNSQVAARISAGLRRQAARDPSAKAELEGLRSRLSAAGIKSVDEAARALDAAYAGLSGRERSAIETGLSGRASPLVDGIYGDAAPLPLAPRVLAPSFVLLGGGAKAAEDLHGRDERARIPAPKVPGYIGARGAAGALILAAAATAAFYRIRLPHTPLMEAFGWGALASYLIFPVVEIRAIFRELAAVKRGGPEGEKAVKHLAGMSPNSHVIIKIGKLLKYPAYLATGSPALIFNTVLRTFLSWFILAQLNRAGFVSLRKLLGVTVAVVGIFAAAPFLKPYPGVMTALGMVGAFLYALHQLPQYWLNHKALSSLRHPDLDLVASEFRRLEGNMFYYHLFVLIGAALMIPLDLSTGLWYNAGATLFIALVTLMIFAQLHHARVLPWQRSARDTTPRR